MSYKRQPPRKRCEKELHEKLTNLLLELTPWESKLAKFAIRNREKLKKEFEAAQLIPVTDQVGLEIALRLDPIHNAQGTSRPCQPFGELKRAQKDWSPQKGRNRDGIYVRRVL